MRAAAHHVPWLRCNLLLVLVGLRTLLRRSRWSTVGWRERNDVVLLAIFLHLSKNSEASLWRNQAWHNLLSNILRWCPQEIFKLDRAKLLYNCALFADALMESFFEFIKFAFFFVKVFYKSSSSFLHLMKSAFKSLDDSSHWALYLSSVLRVPDVMSNELLDGFFPLVLQVCFITHHL